MSIHDGHRRRLKEEFLARSDSFPDHKLLELFLFYANPRADTNPLAHALMDRFGSISGVLDALPEELEKVPGVGRHTVVLLKAAKALGGGYLASRIDKGERITAPSAAYPILRPYFFGARDERVCLLCLDGRGRNLGVRQLSEGNVNAAEVTTRGVVEAALSLNATQVILAHNHPSGLALPSDEDKVTTRHLAKVLAAVNVELWDHQIYCDDDMVSLQESGFRFLGE